MEFEQAGGARRSVRVTGSGLVFGDSTPLGMRVALNGGYDLVEVLPGSRVVGAFRSFELLFPEQVPSSPLVVHVLGDPVADVVHAPGAFAHRVASGRDTSWGASAVEVVTLPALGFASGRPRALQLRGVVTASTTTSLPWAYAYWQTPDANALIKPARMTANTAKNLCYLNLDDWTYPPEGGVFRIENAATPSIRTLTYDLWAVLT